MNRKYLCELADILAVQFECANCRVAISIPVGRGIGKEERNRAIAACAYCKTPSGLQGAPHEYADVCAFLERLETVAKSVNSRNLKISLEIKSTEYRGNSQG